MGDKQPLRGNHSIKTSSASGVVQPDAPSSAASPNPSSSSTPDRDIQALSSSSSSRAGTKSPKVSVSSVPSASKAKSSSGAFSAPSSVQLNPAPAAKRRESPDPSSGAHGRGVSPEVNPRVQSSPRSSAQPVGKLSARTSPSKSVINGIDYSGLAVESFEQEERVQARGKDGSVTTVHRFHSFHNADAPQDMIFGRERSSSDSMEGSKPRKSSKPKMDMSVQTLRDSCAQTDDDLAFDDYSSPDPYDNLLLYPSPSGGGGTPTPPFTPVTASSMNSYVSSRLRQSPVMLSGHLGVPMSSFGIPTAVPPSGSNGPMPRPGHRRTSSAEMARPSDAQNAFSLHFKKKLRDGIEDIILKALDEYNAGGAVDPSKARPNIEQLLDSVIPDRSPDSILAAAASSALYPHSSRTPTPPVISGANRDASSEQQPQPSGLAGSLKMINPSSPFMGPSHRKSPSPSTFGIAPLQVNPPRVSRSSSDQFIDLSPHYISSAPIAFNQAPSAPPSSSLLAAELSSSQGRRLVSKFDRMRQSWDAALPEDEFNRRSPASSLSSVPGAFMPNSGESFERAPAPDPIMMSVGTRNAAENNSFFGISQHSSQPPSALGPPQQPPLEVPAAVAEWLRINGMSLAPAVAASISSSIPSLPMADDLYGSSPPYPSPMSANLFFPHREGSIFPQQQHQHQKPDSQQSQNQPQPPPPLPLFASASDVPAAAGSAASASSGPVSRPQVVVPPLFPPAPSAEPSLSSAGAQAAAGSSLSSSTGRSSSKERHKSSMKSDSHRKSSSSGNAKHKEDGYVGDIDIRPIRPHDDTLKPSPRLRLSFDNLRQHGSEDIASPDPSKSAITIQSPRSAFSEPSTLRSASSSASSPASSVASTPRTPTRHHPNNNNGNGHNSGRKLHSSSVAHA